MAKKTTLNSPPRSPIASTTSTAACGGRNVGSTFSGRSAGGTDDFEIRLEAGNDDPFLFWTGGIPIERQPTVPSRAVVSFPGPGRSRRSLSFVRSVDVIKVVIAQELLAL